ncbi:MAG: DUF1071 domain-containing protein [Verrucomicrobiota bacterium]
MSYLELRKINVNEHTEKKGKFTYLSWAWAVDQLLQADPMATWDYQAPMAFGDTLMVFCSVAAFGKTMTAQLPVLNPQNKAISNPDAFAVNTAMQRCLAKAIALHGIGLYIYAGEDIPDEPTPDLTADANLWVDSIKNCTTIDQLKDVYGKAYAAVAKDKNAVQLIANAKDLKKGEFA